LCEDCGEFEVLVSRIEDAVCPECGKPVTRLWTPGEAFKIKLSGNGYYSTEYSDKKNRLQ